MFLGQLQGNREIIVRESDITMKILTIVPQSEKAKTVQRDVLYGAWCKGNRIGGGSLPPLSLLHVSSVLKNDGHDVQLVDMMEQKLGLAEIQDTVKMSDMVIVLTSTMSFLEDSAFLKKLKAIKGDLRTVIFGSHPTFMPEDCLSTSSIDFVVKREPEFIIRDLARSLRDGPSKTDFSDILGLGFKKGSEMFINENRASTDDCESLPIPDRKLLPKKSRYFNPIIKKYPYATAITSRGCAAKCTFCTASYMMGNKLRYWSAAKTIEEIEYLLGLGYKEIYYRDETFTTFKKRNLEIFETIIKKKLKFSWICNVRADTVDREDLILMKKAGCRLIKVGVETGSEEILRRVKKNITLEQVRSVFKWCNEIKIDTHAHFMFGMPGETISTLNQTLKFIKEIKPTTIDIGICTPYPGTELFEEVVRGNKECLNMDQFPNLSNLHIKARYNASFTNVDNSIIEEYMSKAYRKFYINFYYFLKCLWRIRSLSELLNLSKAGINVISFALNKEKELKENEDRAC